MLLRQAEPADADTFIAMGSSPEAQQGTAHVVDPLDDVFGSDDDDDGEAVFETELHHTGRRITDTRELSSSSSGTRNHPSDMHRLQQEHTTAGYRDGITVAKAQSVQAGFDEGFSLGAVIGMKAGYLLGVLEGIAGALRGKQPGGGEAAAAAAHADQLLRDARRELAMLSMFGDDYWNADGTWKYEVKEEEAEVVFSDVAEAHPLVRKWTAVVETEMGRWGIERGLSLLQRPAEEETHRPTVKAKGVSQTQAEPRDALNW